MISNLAVAAAHYLAKRRAIRRQTRERQHFLRIAFGLDTDPALAELAAQPELWNLLTLRQQYAGSAHADTEMIALRGPTTTERLFDNLETINFPTMEQLPQIRDLVRSMLDRLEARDVGRIMVVRLKAGGRIAPHVDEGLYARYFARFHLVLRSHPGCLFTAGTETVNMATGEMWWFNHQVSHSVRNDGPERIQVIFDACAPGFTGAVI
jgi:hypothetical protein